MQKHHTKAKRLMCQGISLLFLASQFTFATTVLAQQSSRPWMNATLPPSERAELVLKQLTLDEKITLLHGHAAYSELADATHQSG